MLRFTIDVDRSMFFCLQERGKQIIYIFCMAGETALADVVSWVKKGNVVFRHWIIIVVAVNVISGTCAETVRVNAGCAFIISQSVQNNCIYRGIINRIFLDRVKQFSDRVRLAFFSLTFQWILVLYVVVLPVNVLTAAIIRTVIRVNEEHVWESRYDQLKIYASSVNMNFSNVTELMQEFLTGIS